MLCGRVSDPCEDCVGGYCDMNCSPRNKIADHQPDDRYVLSADVEDHPLWKWGFAIQAHNRTASAAPLVTLERRYGYRSQHACETGMESAYQRWSKFFGDRLNR